LGSSFLGSGVYAVSNYYFDYGSYTYYFFSPLAWLLDSGLSILLFGIYVKFFLVSAANVPGTYPDFFISGTYSDYFNS